MGNEDFRQTFTGYDDNGKVSFIVNVEATRYYVHVSYSIDDLVAHIFEWAKSKGYVNFKLTEEDLRAHCDMSNDAFYYGCCARHMEHWNGEYWEVND